METYFLSFLFFSLLFLFQCTITTLAQAPAQPPAQAPALPQTPALVLPPAPPGPTDVIKILEKAGQFTTLVRLLKITHVGDQLNGQLNDSNSGLTIFAPTDGAFSSLKAGTLNSLSNQEQSQLVQFHIIPSFISTSQFQAVSNPLRTQAGDTGPGQFPLNVLTSGNHASLSTGYSNATVASVVYSDNQLAVYEVDHVLRPWAIFGPKVPAPAPALAPAPGLSKKPKNKSVDGLSSNVINASGAVVGLGVHGFLVGFMGLVGGFYL